MEASISDELLSRFSEFVAGAMGLHFPPSRWPDLRRGIASAAAVLDFQDCQECVQWLMSAPLSKVQLEALASNLTVGETYFFRDRNSFDVLAEQILPPLIHARKDERRLRIWSAACCTGEEAYSIAIALHRLIADWRDWNITLLASDINPRFLRKAEAGVFGRWSFRGAPDWLLENYFRAVGNDQFQILPEIRQAVQFQQLNLVDDVYPSLANDTNAMDVIFCRNVLMYFTEPQAKKVLHNLYRAQMDGGWLIVSPSELMHVSATPYILRKFADAMVYQKDTSRPRQSEERTWAAPIVVDIPTAPPPLEPVAEAAVLYERGNYQDAAEKLDDVATESNKPASLSLLARALANQGKFAESLARCDQWVAADKLNPGAHYLRAVILQEQGSIEQAAAALRQTLYLDADFALAHFALANIARHRGHGEQAENHLKRALASLRLCRAEEPLPESDGITAGRFAEIISALLNDQPTV